MDKLKDIVTGGAYKKPAKTADGAFTTQDSSDAHTLEGTSAKDPEVKSTGVQKELDNVVDKGASEAGVPQSADSKINQEVNQRI